MTQALPRTYQELRWTDDMSPQAAETASDLESLEQDVLHIIAQVLGSNLDNENTGIGIVDYLGSTSAQLATVPGQLDAQLLDDARITNSTTTIVQQADLTFQIQCSVIVAGQVVNLNYTLGPNGLSVAA